MSTFDYPGFTVTVEDAGGSVQPWGKHPCYTATVTVTGQGHTLTGTFYGSQHDRTQHKAVDHADAARCTCDDYASYYNDPDEFLEMLLAGGVSVDDFRRYSGLVAKMDAAKSLLAVIADTPAAWMDPDD